MRIKHNIRQSLNTVRLWFAFCIMAGGLAQAQEFSQSFDPTELASRVDVTVGPNRIIAQAFAVEAGHLNRADVFLWQPTPSSGIPVGTQFAILHTDIEGNPDNSRPALVSGPINGASIPFEIAGPVTLDFAPFEIAAGRYAVAIGGGVAGTANWTGASGNQFPDGAGYITEKNQIFLPFPPFSSYGDNDFGFRIVWAPLAVAPVIEVHPASRTVDAGGEAVFAVIAVGTPPLSFQWRRNGVNVLGATSSTLTLGPVQAADAGSYDVIVSNVAGSVVSNPAILEVNSPNTPPVVAAIQDVAIVQGDLLRIQVRATDADLPAQVLTYAVGANAPTGASITSSGQFVFATSELLLPGSYVISITVTDPLGASDTASFTVVVGDRQQWEQPEITGIGFIDGQVEFTIRAEAPRYWTVQSTSLPLTSATIWLDEATYFGGPDRTFQQELTEPGKMYRVRDAELLIKGGSLLIVGSKRDSLGADTYLEVDSNGDRVTDETVRADLQGEFVLAVGVTGNSFDSRVRWVEGDTEITTGWEGTRTRQDPSPETDTGNQTFDNHVSQASLCGCIECEENTALGFGDSLTPHHGGMDLATGQLRVGLQASSQPGIELGVAVNFSLVTLADYNGPFGRGVTHSLNWQIIQTGELSGRIVTEKGRSVPISSVNGQVWDLPPGVVGRLTLDTALRQWDFTRVSGVRMKFFQNLLNMPGYLLSATSPNGNQMRIDYNDCFIATSFKNDLGHTLVAQHSVNPHLRSLTDHLGRTWTMNYDAQNRLIEIASPATEFADIAAGTLLTDSTLAGVLVTRPRMTTLAYNDPNFPNHVTSITDERDATTRSWTYDAQGRVSTATIHGNTTTFIYNPTDNPTPLPVLDQDNFITREIDPEGNITDYEMHGPSHIAKFGLRRKVIWTESGKGNAPLRAGEPLYWEQRWLHDCECLAPVAVTQPFSSLDKANVIFDANGIPENWPRTLTTYNVNKQVLSSVYTDGTESIRTETTYQPGSFGVNNEFSKMLTRTDPRAFDSNPIYAGLNFVHTYEYDSRGNMTNHTAPTVTRGVVSPQAVVESWTYNQFGQVLRHTDPNGNVTVNTYHTGPPTGGDINTKGDFFGFLASTTRGAAGSFDPAVNLTTSYLVNALGQVTRMIDPMGHEYDTEYNDLGELVRNLEPAVTLRNGTTVRYETRQIYDGAGNVVMTRRSNLDYLGQVHPNEFIDHSMSYDAGNHLLAERREVDANDNNDLITRYARDRNDQLIAIEQPERNRVFSVFDERRMLLRQFTGVAPDANILSGYPADKRATDLGGTGFVALTRSDYDSRGNPVISYDGRGNTVISGFDFRNRQVFAADQNRNGWIRYYDDAGNVLATEQGAMPGANGVLSQVLARSYARIDEVGRRYQAVQDINPATSELNAVDPAGADNSSFATLFDAGSRTLASLDAIGNATSLAYDAANRRTTVTDALGNTVTTIYDRDSNVIEIQETELPGPGAVGLPQTYYKTNVYDALSRRIETRVLGLDRSINHRSATSYDSRGNAVLMLDAEGKAALNTYDDQNRLVRMQRFNMDPAAVGAQELQRSEFHYDGNSRKTADIAFSIVTDPASAQITSYGWDTGDRQERVIYPDSEDADDVVRTAYDANGNPVWVRDQRGVMFTNVFDPGNRLTNQLITLPPSVPGTTRQSFGYDALNRLTHAANNYAHVGREYDALSRQTNEIQSIRLDGSGFVNGWEQPVHVSCAFDKQANNTGCTVSAGGNIDLSVTRTMDALNRVDTMSAAYFNTNRLIVDYNYFGPGRIQTKTLGNGARMVVNHDLKRRMASMVWTDPLNVLVGFVYGYDDVDNVLSEQWLHDGGLYDHFGYNDRYELTHVTYRSPDPNPPAAWRDTFDYDDNYNRKTAAFGVPFEPTPSVTDTYAANAVNEYTSIVRNGQPFVVEHDRAGNMTQFPVRPATITPQADVQATARWDAFNLMFDIENPATGKQHYRYDPFRRRIAVLDSETDLQGSSRVIYEGWSDIEERIFNLGAILASAPSRLERIYVEGPRIDEHLVAAIDRDGDGDLGGANLKNQRDITADQEYFFLQNRLGSTMALSHADNAGRILEYVRYSAYGEATVLTVIDANSDGREDTPLDLSDNTMADPRRFSEEFGSAYLGQGRCLDEKPGLYYFRTRNYEPVIGRFLSRDLAGYLNSFSLLQALENNPVTLIDPLGLYATLDECVHDQLLKELGDFVAGSIPGVKWIVDELQKERAKGKSSKEAAEEVGKRLAHRQGQTGPKPVGKIEGARARWSRPSSRFPGFSYLGPWFTALYITLKIEFAIANCDCTKVEVCTLCDEDTGDTYSYTICTEFGTLSLAETFTPGRRVWYQAVAKDCASVQTTFQSEQRRKREEERERIDRELRRLRGE